MAIRRQQIKVLRFWYRISTTPQVRALPHPAFRWFEGCVMAWTGHNNGVIEFTRRRHGPLYGLENPKVFERARKDLLDANLIMMTHPGGNSVPAKFAIVQVPLQLAPDGMREVPSAEKMNGISGIPSRPKSGMPEIPSRYAGDTVKTDLHIRTARASEYRKSKTKTPNTKSTTISDANAANSDARHEGEVKANGTSHASNQSDLVSGSRH